MNAAQLLSSKGVTMQQASDWVQAHLDQPGTIYSTCLEFGINSTMLAEIVQPFVPGVGASEVEAFFVSHGFDAQVLRNAGAVEPVPNADDFAGFFPQEFSGLLSILTLNSNAGALSNSSLRDASLAQLDQDSFYWSLFSPASFGGEADGVWTSSELGFGNLGNLPATAETLESLFYGSIIQMARAIDEAEVSQLEVFLNANEAALQAGNVATVNSFVQQLTQAFATPAAVPLVSDEELATFLPVVTATAAQLVGTGGSDLFDSLFSII